MPVKRAPLQTLYKILPQGKSILYGWFESMHTRMDVILCHISEEKGKKLLETIQETTETISRQVNRFDPSSEISFVNHHAFEKEISLSPTLYKLLEYSIQAYRITEGYFDITIQSPDTYRKGPGGIILNPENHTIRFQYPDIQIDLCGIAKGYALDQCLNLLLQEEARDLFISFGNSSILGCGNHPNGNGWIVAGRENSHLPAITLQNEYLTISGNESPERKHLIQPSTKTYITGQKEIAVKTQSGLLGEILSTAYFVAPLNDQKKLQKIHQKNATFYTTP